MAMTSRNSCGSTRLGSGLGPRERNPHRDLINPTGTTMNYERDLAFNFSRP